jgi:hypothetical protein
VALALDDHELPVRVQAALAITELVIVHDSGASEISCAASKLTLVLDAVDFLDGAIQFFPRIFGLCCSWRWQFTEMLPSLDNFVSYGTDVLKARPDYRSKVLDMYRTAMTSPQLGDNDKISLTYWATQVVRFRFRALSLTKPSPTTMGLGDTTMEQAKGIIIMY